MVTTLNIDAQLVEEAKKGDSDCFSRLYELVQDDLYKYALYALGNAHDAEDVVAETFLEAFRGISKLREPSAFKSWIFKILSIRIKRRISHYIKEKKQMQIEDFIADPALQMDGMDASVIARTDLLQAMETLSTQERMILTLSVLYGYTTKQISQMLHSPHGTVSSKLHRSLKKLKSQLEEKEGDANEPSNPH